ncbi:hypothetical protein ACB092_03G086700 [Castanea dentata]
MGKITQFLPFFLASLLFFISHSQSTSNTSSQHHCLPDISDDYYGVSYPKMKSWKADTDCCSWDSITCDAKSGQSTIPSEFGRLVRLTRLNLSFSYLSGQIPSEISWLSNLYSKTLNLKKLDLETLVQNITNLRELQLASVNISSSIPQSLVNLSSLTTLSLANCNLHGQFPTNILLMPKLSKIDLSYNHFLTGFLPEFHSGSSLELLDLSSTNFSGILPNSIDNLESLIKLDLSQTNQLPSTLGNLANLSFLDLSNNLFHGEIPSSLGNLTQLALHQKMSITSKFLSLFNNSFDGRLPVSLTNLTQLYTMNIFQNQLIGPIPCEIGRLFQLADISLGSNSLTGTSSSQLFTMGSLFTLDLSQNQLTGSLKLQNISSSQLNYLDLTINKLYGSIPRSITNFTYLQYLYLCSINPKDMLELSLFFSLKVLNLSFFQTFLMTNLKAYGFEQPLNILPWKNMRYLDLRSNMLQGLLPTPPFNSLSILNMRKNSFQGKLPETFTKGSNLRTLDLSLNIINGKIPRSLVKCGMPEVLNPGNNNLNDIFPYWLESLLELKILILLPSEYFNTWYAMLMAPGINSKLYLLNKGVEMELVKILTIFTAIDFSNNKFYGEIPNNMGNLKELIVLNLSSNSFTGPILSSFGNLIELQSFDLSRNNLTFLAYLNLSQNQLTGPIPQDRQFGTFQNSSFEGNLGLCGFPLSKKCENIETPTFELNQESSYGEGFSWKVVVMGYASGLVIGLVIGHVIISRRSNNWFTRTLGVNLHM